MSDNVSIVNGAFVPAADASLRVGDLSVQRGYGIFDFFRTIGGRPVFWDDHIGRLFRSAAEMRLPLPFDRGRLREMLVELVRRNGHIADVGIRITVTGGYSPDGYAIATPNVVVTASPMKMADPKIGLKLITHVHQRQLPQVKTIDYLMAVWLRDKIAARNADDVLYRDPAGVVTECPRANFGIITQDGVLATPSKNILIGVTRKYVLEAARRLLKVEERDVTVDEVYRAREAFILGTSRRLGPIIEIDGHKIGDGAFGPVSQKLLAGLDERIALETR